MTLSRAPDPATAPEAFIARYQRAIWLWLRVLGSDEALADDLTQETLLKALHAAADEQLVANLDAEMLAW
ncbi:MAG: hypothetical protein KDB07_12935, partial [Planctomycetes bacterium]|nr:hypothetical protein [Planctomycetota bacterium]